MKRFIYILLAGLAAAGLASCDKQDLKSVKSVSEGNGYSIEVVAESDSSATKASEACITPNGYRYFYAILRKNGKPIDCDDWQWKEPDNCSIVEKKTTVGCWIDGFYTMTKVGRVKLKGESGGSSMLYASTDPENTGGVDIDPGFKPVSVANVTGLAITVASPELMAGGHTAYTVTATYENGKTSTVTDIAEVTASSPLLSAEGGTVTSTKGNGCLGQFALTASLGNVSASAYIKVVTDFISVSSLTFTLSNSYGSDTSNGSKVVTAFVPRGNSGNVTFYASVGVSSYNPGGEVVLKVDNDVIDNDGSKTWDMHDGDTGELRIYYLGDLVGTCRYSIQPY